MKTLLLSSLTFISFIFIIGCQNESKRIENIKAFSKIYGYVRWFHPSDEAQDIDWDEFACFGAKMVENAPTSKALKDSLLLLFSSVAPSLDISNIEDMSSFDISNISPHNSLDYIPVFWQHLGVELNSSPPGIYGSMRINRIDKAKYKASISISKIIDASKYVGKEIRLTVDVKADSGSIGIVSFDGLSAYEYVYKSGISNQESFSNENWENIELSIKLNENDNYIFLGFNNLDCNNVLIDNIEISVINNELGDSIIYENQFNMFQEDLLLTDFVLRKSLPFDIKKVNRKERGDSCLAMKFNRNFKLFNKEPEFGEYISDQIHPKLHIYLPIVLLANTQHTYPIADYRELNLLKSKLNVTQSNYYKNLGSLIITWNIIQHFFPYFEEIEIDWTKEYDKALADFNNGMDITKTLKKLLAPLNDGHIYIYNSKSPITHILPIVWEWIEGKLVITRVLDEKLKIAPGSEISSINGKSPEEYFSEVEEYISAGTVGYLRHLSQYETLCGKEGEKLNLIIIDSEKTHREIELTYSFTGFEYHERTLSRTRYKKLENNILYLNLDQISMAEIYDLMADIEKCNGIVGDLRGYANGNLDFFAHLMKETDTVDNWIGLLDIIYPNQQNIAGWSYPNAGSGMLPKIPFLDIPVVLITDGRAISYAESVALFVEHYNLATIIGQPTAGTNGSINGYQLPNGLQFGFTGSKVTTLGNKRHYGVGVLPDIYVEKTVQGVKAEKDEYLVKALEILSKGNYSKL